MRLELRTVEIKDVVLGHETCLSAGILKINVEQLKDLLLPDPFIDAIEIDVVRPGESARIIHALDIVEPRFKISGSTFPGRLGPCVQVGRGTTVRLSGMAVVGVAEPFVGEEFWYAREAIIDMSGPGAFYSPFSNTINLVIKFVPKPGGKELDPETREQFIVDTRTRQAELTMKATRILCLKVAEFLARQASDLQPDKEKVFALEPVDPDLTKVVYICKSMAAAFYGSFSTRRNWALLMHPNEMIDGAVTNTGYLVPAHFRDATYNFQNNSIVEELYSRHGVDINFRGVLFYNGYPYTLEGKELEAGSVVRAARVLGANGAIIAPLSDGHPSVETMMICRMCEDAGIRTAIGVGEMTAGKGDPGLTHWVPEADAIVIGGDSHHKVVLPSVDKVVGGYKELRLGQYADGEIEVEARQMYGANNPGANTNLAGRLY